MARKLVSQATNGKAKASSLHSYTQGIMVISRIVKKKVVTCTSMISNINLTRAMRWVIEVIDQGTYDDRVRGLAANMRKNEASSAELCLGPSVLTIEWAHYSRKVNILILKEIMNGRFRRFYQNIEEKYQNILSPCICLGMGLYVVSVNGVTQWSDIHRLC